MKRFNIKKIYYFKLFFILIDRKNLIKNLYIILYLGPENDLDSDYIEFTIQQGVELLEHLKIGENVLKEQNRFLFFIYKTFTKERKFKKS